MYSRRKKEEGRRKKEEAIKSIVSAINNVLSVGRGCYNCTISQPIIRIQNFEDCPTIFLASYQPTVFR